MVENAVKHNVVNSSNVLRISIGVEMHHVVVRNNLNPKKADSETSPGTGLQNISRQYEILFSRSVVNREDRFRVHRTYPPGPLAMLPRFHSMKDWTRSRGTITGSMFLGEEGNFQTELKYLEMVYIADMPTRPFPGYLVEPARVDFPLDGCQGVVCHVLFAVTGNHPCRLVIGVEVGDVVYIDNQNLASLTSMVKWCLYAGFA